METRWEYDSHGSQIRMTEYDAAGEILGIMETEDGISTYRRYENGVPVYEEITAANGRITVTEHRQDGSRTVSELDQNGVLLCLTEYSPDGTSVFVTFDASGNTLEEIWYDADGNMTETIQYQ